MQGQGKSPANTTTTAPLEEVRTSKRPLLPGPCSLRCNGFTLLEVLAAIALLAIAFAIGLSALGAAARNASRSVALDTAVERAQSLLAGQGLTAPLKNETLSGKFDDGMAWTLKIHVLPQPAHAQGVGADPGSIVPNNGVMLAQASAIALYQLDVSVQYGEHRTLRLSTQRAQAVLGGAQ